VPAAQGVQVALALEDWPSGPMLPGLQIVPAHDVEPVEVA
jgi:hypothetical protein